MAINRKYRKRIQEFVNRWNNVSSEKSKSHNFWVDLLRSVYVVEAPEIYIEFEKPVKPTGKKKGNDYIDAYIPQTKVLIEQKNSQTNLSLPQKQSDGTKLTPYEQACRYAEGLNYSEKPRWIITSNFKSFHIYDMDRRGSDPEVINLKDLPENYEKLLFLIDENKKIIHKEDRISLEAGKIVGELYNLLLVRYDDPNDENSLKSLNKLCVRLVFCLYADDAGIFPIKKMFHDYLEQYDSSELRSKLIELFKILNTPQEDRDKYLPEELLDFPYVNGGLFDGEIEIPRLNYDIKEMLLEHGSKDFNWADISPTIFGAVFESTLNPETRRAGGMHYTSIENIHKVIDPLFLDSLRDELSEISKKKQESPRRDRALAFQKKLASLIFLDPACGSGNFLTETYISLRKLENQALSLIQGYDVSFGEGINPVKVSPSQFHGIEINDFACSVAQTALWIAELQMMAETIKLFHSEIKKLPLKNYQSITEGNALRIDWNEVIPASSLNYIIGNPPFSGARVMDKSQKEDLFLTLGKNWKGLGNLDYVSGWYKKSLDMMKLNPKIRAALVSTNSISQGEQVALLWKPLSKDGLKIDFAYRSFVWDSETQGKAHVHCVIEGFSLKENEISKLIFHDKEPKAAKI